MKLTETPQKPFDEVIVDTVGPLTKSENNNVYAVTMICNLSKYLIMTPVQDKTAKSIAKAIFENLILQYGPIKKIRTDRGSEYNNALVRELCEMLGITQNLSTAYHHETLGSIEKNHRTLNEYIRIYVTNMEEWDKYIQYFAYCYNTAKHSAFNNEYSPYELVFGKSPRQFNEILTGSIDIVYNIENYINELKYKLQIAHEQAKSFVEKNKILSKQFYDRKLNSIDIKIGDKIKIEKQPRNKFKQIFEGPYTVMGMDEENITYVKNDKTVTTHKNRIKKY